MLIGIISDTHGFVDPQIPEIFAGVQHILHAGDIGLHSVLLELERIAPVTAVLGNTDSLVHANLTEVVTLEARKFLVHHIVAVHSLEEQLKLRIAREAPDVVVFGHTHRPFSETIGETLYLNPGYAGKPRFNLPRTVVVMETGEHDLEPRFISL